MSLATLESVGLIEVTGRTVRLTVEGATVADAVALVGKRIVLRQALAVTTCEMKVVFARVWEDSFDLCDPCCNIEIRSGCGKIEVQE